jgi:hypothetical protein
MSRGHHVEPPEPPHQVLAITANITRGRDVLAALAAAWSSSANQLNPDSTHDDTSDTKPCAPSSSVRSSQ